MRSRLGVIAAVTLATAPAGGQGFDPAAHLFLEEVEGERALEWVRGQNARSLAALEADPGYQQRYDDALDILQSTDRIPYGGIQGGWVHNFWQDATHVRGIWRRAPLDGYLAGNPVWQTVLDIDALSDAEGANWVYRGNQCLPPDQRRCLVTLSDGGKDAARIREFDSETKQFIAGGFDLAEAKSSVAWINRDELLVSTDWGEGSLTESGYPFIVKRLRRGQSLDQAVEVFRGAPANVGVWPLTLEDTAGNRWHGVVQAESFFTTTAWLLGNAGEPMRRLPLPPKSSVVGVHADRLLFTVQQDWNPEQGGEFKSGDLLAFAWSEFLAGNNTPAMELIFRPNSRQSIEGVSISRSGMLMSLADNVVTRVMRWSVTDGQWTSTDVDLPGNGTASVMFASPREDLVFVGHQGFLDPSALYLLRPGSVQPEKFWSLAPRFDAERFEVQQHQARSRDGTMVPYFVVGPRGAPRDGSNPVQMYGYGGFQVSYTPWYSATTGKLWLEQGGTFVLANIRGGGEFGPAWHQAGLKTNRQVVYDDFIAVAEDLIARGITTPQHLGITGGSNGGLLMGVMFTQRPDLFGAIVTQVPLLDMLRYHLLLAGASWMDEYGDPEVPEERAWLEQMSPYHNVKAGVEYPEMFLLTSTKDDRVHPGHARKMGKRLEELGIPFLYYENIDGGHSAAANQRETARRLALEYTYLSRKLVGRPVP